MSSDNEFSQASPSLYLREVLRERIPDKFRHAGIIKLAGSEHGHFVDDVDLRWYHQLRPALALGEPLRSPLDRHKTFGIDGDDIAGIVPAVAARRVNSATVLRRRAISSAKLARAFATAARSFSIAAGLGGFGREIFATSRQGRHGPLLEITTKRL